MQMRSGDATGRADSADPRAGRDPIPECNFDCTEMRVQRQKTLAVVEDYGVSGKKIIADVDHCCFARSDDRRSIRGGNVHAVVGIARLAIEEAPLSKRIGS